MGRKKADDNSENKNARLSVYLTPSLYEDVQDLARLSRVSLADYVAALISADVDDKKEALIKFREIKI